jgi:hypothetical protein
MFVDFGSEAFLEYWMQWMSFSRRWAGSCNDIYCTCFLVLLPIVLAERFSDSHNLRAQSSQQCVPHLPGFGWS